jgi:hypothetical protein
MSLSHWWWRQQEPLKLPSTSTRLHSTTKIFDCGLMGSEVKYSYSWLQMFQRNMQPLSPVLKREALITNYKSTRYHRPQSTTLRPWESQTSNFRKLFCVSWTSVSFSGHLRSKHGNNFTFKSKLFWVGGRPTKGSAVSIFTLLKTSNMNFTWSVTIY